MKVSLTQQIEELRRNNRVMAGLDADETFRKRMRESERRLHADRRDAILETLTWLWKNEAAVRDLMVSNRGDDIAAEHEQPLSEAKAKPTME